MKTSVVPVGVIGTGGMGFQHALNVNSFATGKVVAIADADEKRVKEAATQLGNPTWYTDPLKLIADSEVHAVVIASPDATHAQYVMKALEYEKPVLCEKPLATTVDDALAIIQKEVELKKRLVAVGFQRRFDPTHVAIKEAISNTEMGKTLSWKGVHRNAEAMYGTDGDFILNNSAGHDVDSARWLLDSTVKSVYTLGIKSREELPNNARDLLYVNMVMENGTTAVAEVYVNARYGYEVEVEMVCQNGVVSSIPKHKVSVRHQNNQGSYATSDFRGYFIEGYIAEMEHWLHSLIHGTSFEGASSWDGYCAMITTMAASESLEKGTPVSVITIEKPHIYN